MRRPSALLVVIAFAAAWAAALYRFPFEGPYNSDSAIPVLMANWDSWSAFHLYYFGQDRFGALPFNLMQLVHWATRYSWTPESVTFVHAGAALLTAWPVSRLFKQRMAAAVFTLLIIVAMPSAFFVFSISQPYGWQLPLFFGAWAALRHLRTAPTGRSFALALALCFSAAWLSALSAPLLLLCAAVEAVSATTHRRRALVLAPVLLGGGLEGVVRGITQVYSKSHFGHSFRTDVRLVFDGAFDALVTLLRAHTGPGFVLTFIAIAAGAWAFFRVIRKREATDAEANLLALAMVLGAQLVLLSLGDHFRKNGLDPRYLAMAEVFAWLSLLQLFLLVVDKRITERRELALGAVAALFIGVSAFALPRQPPVPEMQSFRDQAFALSRELPRGTLIVSGYWNVYAVAGLAPANALRPLATRGEYDRTVLLRSAIADANMVWLSNAGIEASPPHSSAEKPYAWVQKTLLAKDPEGAHVTVAKEVWRKFVSVRDRSVKPEPRSSCEDVRVQPTKGAELFILLFDYSNRKLPVLRAEDAVGNEVPLTPVDSNGDLFWFRAPADSELARVTLSGFEGRCPVEDVAVLRP